MISYENYMEQKGYNSTNRRKIKASFKNTILKTIHTGDNFDCINVDNNAEKSYKVVLEYYNSTKVKETDADRLFVSAEWDEE